MIIYILIIFFIIVFIIFISKNKWSLSRKVYVSLLCLIISFLILCSLFVYSWNSSISPREEASRTQEYVENTLKKILLINKKQEKVYGEINFEYSKYEINTNNYDIIDYYNKKSLFIINPNSQYSITLPIKANNSFNFPEKLSLIIRDSTQNIIKNYTREEFLKSISSNEKGYIENNEWRLIIE